MISEKDVDHKIKSQFEKLGYYYFTTFQIEPFKTLFGTLIPDGSLVHENNLLIIENKKSLKQEQEALKQLLKYCQTSVLNGWNENIYCVFGCFECVKIYSYQSQLNQLISEKMKLEELLNGRFSKIEQSIESLFHALHNFIISNINTDDNNELCFLCLAMLLTTMKIDIHNSSDEIIFNVIEKIINDELPELKSLIQTVKHENISILAKQIYNLYAIAGKDVYLKLYQEFCKYSKAKDEKNIVLTPDWIVQIMTNELRLSETESNEKLSIFDPCIGTGSLILGSSDFNCTLYGADINRKMYVLCKGLFMLSNSDYQVFYGDMFKMNFKMKFDRIITNPPYSKKLTGFHAINFISYSIENFLNKDGILVAIFPTNQLKTVPVYQKYKEYIFKNCDILKIINLGRCFKNDAPTTDCSILVCRKVEKPNTVKTLVYNIEFNTDIAKKIPYGGLRFTPYGKELIEKVMKNELFEINETCGIELQINSFDMDWTCLNIKSNIQDDIKNTIIADKLKSCKSAVIQFLDAHVLNGELNFDELIKIITDASIEIKSIQSNMNQTKFKEYRIGDLFEVVTNVKLHAINSNKDQPGEYPLVSASKLNNGVVKYINTFDFDSTDHYLVVSTARLTTGFTSYHNEKFSVGSSVKVLKPIVGTTNALQSKLIVGTTNALQSKTKSLEVISKMKEIANTMTIVLGKIYNQNNPLLTEKLMNEMIIVRNDE
jgi:methylase of polypeptide subunit release factors